MFGHNNQVTPKIFAQQPTDTLLVTSTFATIQGEGPFSGSPALFLRLAYCHLACSFCDTYFDRGESMTFDEINNTLDTAGRTAFPLFDKIPPMLVITGGEPMLQVNLLGFLATRQHIEGIVQIETTGSFWLEVPLWTQIVISPKVNARTGEYMKVNDIILAQARSLKFVVSSTMRGYTDIPPWALAWRDERPGLRKIYLSPMNMYNKIPTTPSSLANAKERATRERISFWTPGLLNMKLNKHNHEHTAKLAMQYSCQLSIQQHIYASLP